MLEEHKLETLPAEVLLIIFSYLTPRDLLVLAHVNKEFRNLSATNSLWKAKFAEYFPDTVERINQQKDVNWYQEFKIEYHSQQALNKLNLPLDIQDLLKVIEKGKLEQLNPNQQQLLTNFKYYYSQLHDENFNTTYYPAWQGFLAKQMQREKYQPVLNYLFNTLVPSYTKKDGTIDVRKKNNTGGTILHHAARYNQNNIQELIEQGANVNENSDRGTPLHIAVMYGMNKAVNSLLNNQATVNILSEKSKKTPLYLAAENNNLKIVTMLIPNADVDFPHEFKSTPLYIALDRGYAKIAEALLNANADLKFCVQNGDINLLFHEAFSNGHFDLLPLYLKKGANINTVDAYNNSALHHAASLNNRKAIQLLIKLGIDQTLKNKEGKTARDIAKQKDIQIWEATAPIKNKSESSQPKKNKVAKALSLFKSKSKSKSTDHGKNTTHKKPKKP